MTMEREQEGISRVMEHYYVLFAMVVTSVLNFIEYRGKVDFAIY